MENIRNEDKKSLWSISNLALDKMNRIPEITKRMVSFKSATNYYNLAIKMTLAHFSHSLTHSEPTQFASTD